MTSAFQFLVQVLQQDIRQQRTERPALRRAFRPRRNNAVGHHPRFEIPADEFEYPFVANLLRHFIHQNVVIDPVEEFLQVHVHHNPAAFGNVLPGRLDCLMGALPRSKTVARFGEACLKDRREHLM